MNPQEQCLLIRLLYVMLHECLRAVKSFDELRRTDRTMDDHFNRSSSGLVTRNWCKVSLTDPTDDTTEHTRTHCLLLPECTVATTFKMVCKYRSTDTWGRPTRCTIYIINVFQLNDSLIATNKYLFIIRRLFLYTLRSVCMYTQRSVFLYIQRSVFMCTQLSVFRYTQRSVFLYTQRSVFLYKKRSVFLMYLCVSSG